MDKFLYDRQFGKKVRGYGALILLLILALNYFEVISDMVLLMIFVLLSLAFIVFIFVFKKYFQKVVKEASMNIKKYARKKSDLIERRKKND